MDTDFAALLDSLSKTHTHICCYKITQGVWSNPVRRESADRCGGSSAKQMKRRTGLGGEEGERRGCRICWPRSTAKIILPTDKRGCERRETLKKKKREQVTQLLHSLMSKSHFWVILSVREVSPKTAVLSSVSFTTRALWGCPDKKARLSSARALACFSSCKHVKINSMFTGWVNSDDKGMSSCVVFLLRCIYNHFKVRPSCKHRKLEGIFYIATRGASFMFHVSQLWLFLPMCVSCIFDLQPNEMCLFNQQTSPSESKQYLFLFLNSDLWDSAFCPDPAAQESWNKLQKSLPRAGEHLKSCSRTHQQGELSPLKWTEAKLWSLKIDFLLSCFNLLSKEKHWIILKITSWHVSGFTLKNIQWLLTCLYQTFSP